MKRRNRVGRHRSSSQRKPLDIFAKRAQRKRKIFTFERLEDRFAFSASPVELQTASLSTDAPGGSEAMWQRELQWAVMQAADATNPVLPQYVVMALPTDPLMPDPNNPGNQGQWHLWNIGQQVGYISNLQALYGAPGEDINVVPVWQGTGLNQAYTGAGVVVAVFDTGVQLFHPDLAANIHPTLRLNATTGTNNASPDLIDETGYHGTAVAGLIGAVANNGIGGTGVAPGVILVPIRRDFESPLEEATAFQWVIQHDIDITNNSWGPNHANNRAAIPLTSDELEILRNSVIYGRDGLGIIHVFAAGNDGGPSIPSFGVNGNFDSTSYNAWANSRYTIVVTGVDHDGLYINAGGTFTTYPTAGPNVLVAAPTGSVGSITIGEDNGVGSGIWTTDLLGDRGINSVTPPNGFDFDVDPWPDPDFTSRMNGTSASAPLVTGVIALMLEANPNLTYRDVQEILVRSSRQNAQFESPASGVGATYASQNTWQTNQIGPFRDPDDWIPNSGQSRTESILFPLSDPNNEGFFFGGGFGFTAPDRNDSGRQIFSHYEEQPPLFTNGAGYTVSQGYGIYSEQIGYGHGVIDAAAAVRMAELWHVLGQNIDRLSDRSFTSSVTVTGLNIPAAEKGADPPGGNRIVVPGGIGGQSGFIAYWNEYFAADDPADLTDGPFSGANPPANTRGASYIDFAVPPHQAINVEWVEVRLSISGGNLADLDFLRIMLTSPDGTQSELNNFYLDPDFASPLTTQNLSRPPGKLDPAGDIDVDGGNFLWTFSTNRNWGESTHTSVIIDPVTGEPLLVKDPFFGPIAPIFRDWELHIENWSNSNFGLGVVEIIWHGKPIQGGAFDYTDTNNNGVFDPDIDIQNWSVARAQRVQGFIGIDTNNDEKFNYSRYVQTITDSDGDPDTIRLGDVERVLDYTDVDDNGVFDPAVDIINQEPFAANILVEAFRVLNPGTPGEVIESTATAQFLTGADGNYYFDLDPTQTYVVRITDLSDPTSIAVDDIVTPNSAPGIQQYMPHYLSEWRITPDWFYAPDRDNPLVPGDNPGEIFFGMNDANRDGVMTLAPMPFVDVDAHFDGIGDPIPMAVKNINFLLKRDVLPNQVVINGTVYLDADANGQLSPALDVPLSGVRVYVDANRSGSFDAGEQFLDTAADGTYSFTISASAAATFAVGVYPASSPTSPWESTQPGGLVKSIFAAPGDPASIVNFFLAAPDDTSGVNVGNIVGFVFNDLDGNGAKSAGELGVEGVRVFIDVNENGIWDNNGDAVLDSGEEIGVLTTANGSFFLTNVPGGLHHVTIVTNGTTYQPTSPSNGVRQVTLNNGQTKSGVLFGVRNLANSDWGDLPASYSTTSAGAPSGPSHLLYNHFRLGSNISGEVNGQPSAGANVDTADDGVILVGGILQPGVNTLRVTVSGVGGSLTGWIDWNKNGTFQPNERLIWSTESGTLLGGEADLNPGTHNLKITAPANLMNGPLAARFRWGERGLDFFGPSIIGEVEDYFLASSSVPIFAGDYSQNNVVDAADYVLWRHSLSTNVPLVNDTTPATVSEEDYGVWRANFGATNLNPGGGAGSELIEAEPLQAPVIEESQPSSQPASSHNAPTSLTATVVEPQAPQVDPNFTSTVIVDSTVSVDAPASRSSLLAAFEVESSLSNHFAASTGGTQFGASSVAAQSDADLLLLDQAWAELDDDADADSPIADRLKGEDENSDDLALAAVFEGETDWWAL